MSSALYIRSIKKCIIRPTQCLIAALRTFLGRREPRKPRGGGVPRAGEQAARAGGLRGPGRPAAHRAHARMRQRVVGLDQRSHPEPVGRQPGLQLLLYAAQ